MKWLLLVNLALLIVTGCSGCARPVTPAILSKATPTMTISPTLSPYTVGTSVPFRTLAQGFRLDGTLTKPTLFMAADPASLEIIAPLIDQKHRDILKTVDLNKEVVLAVFAGVKPSGGFSITINAISIAGTEIIVNVELRENDPTLPKIDAATSPYHLVTIDCNKWLENPKLSYRLVGNNTILAEGTLP